jgi:hypothetical protein
VVSAAAQAALLTVRMRARRAPGDPLIFHKTRVPSTAKEACARQFRRHNDERPSTSWTRDTPGTPRRAIGPPGAAPGAARKTRSQASDPVSVSAYLCNFLHDRGIKPAKVLKNAGVIHDTQADWHRGDAVHALYMAALPLMPQALYSDSEAASASDASLIESDSDSH